MSQKSRMLIASECFAIEQMLQEKNRKYGDSALQPVTVGGQSVPAATGILVRIGDKWKRWNTSAPGEDEDVVLDLIGYLILLRVARRMEKGEAVGEDAAEKGQGTP